MRIPSKRATDHRKCRAIICSLFFALMSTTAAQPAIAQTAASAVANADVSVTDLATRIDLLETRTDLSQTERDRVLEQLRAAVSRAEAADAARKSANEYADGLQSAQDTIAALSAESASTSEPDELPQTTDPVAMQLRLAALQAESVSLRSKQRTLAEQLRAMEGRPSEARAELADLRIQLERKQVPIAGNASPLLVEASRLHEQAAHQELSARTEKIEQELLSLPTRKSIATAQLDLLARRIAEVDAAIEAMNARIASRRKQQVEQEEALAREFERSLAGQPAPIREFAAESVALRTALSQLSERLTRERGIQNRSKRLLDDANEARTSADQILAIGSISDASAKLLRGLQNNLVTDERIQQRISERNNALVDLRVQQFQTQQALRTLQPATAAKRYLAANGIVPAGDELTLMETLVQRRGAALADLADAQGQLISQMSECSALDAELLQVSVQLNGLLDERLLWLPSTVAVGGDWLRDLGVGAVWLLTPANWIRIPAQLASTLRGRPLTLLLIIATVIVLFLIRKRLVAGLQAWARPVGHRDDSFQITLLTWGATSLLALGWPMAVGIIGWGLRWHGDGGFVQALGEGVLSLAIVWLMLGLFIDMCRPHGLFVAHFGWDKQNTQRLGRALRLLLLMLAPTALLTGMTDSSGDPKLIDGIGRLGFLLGSVALALFLYRVYWPASSAKTGAMPREGKAKRMPVIWSRVLVAVPLLLAGLAAMGYYATARELQARLFTSGWVLLAVVIAYYIAMRGVLVASQRAAWQQADARYAKARAEALAAQADESTDGSEALALKNQEAEIDAVTVSQQTRALLRAASGVVLALLLLGIWRGMIPALNVFNDVVLWSHMVAGEGRNTLAAVTLGDVLMSLLALGLTAIVASNLPGFLEMVLLQRFRIDSGTRYAITTIARYAILGIGLIIAFNGIGADWSKLQWIVAALGVGLGFGLQEIVANFISGLIILFERPVRVGDRVTIGDTTGIVSRIKIRAITITDFDNLEVLVPNKAFITEKVQNWTLSSEVTRLRLKVGIGYGSDVQQAHRVMLEVAASHPKVLKFPAPSVLFLGLGDSALEFELRVHVGAVEERLTITDALYTALVAALSNAAIDIPFPQLDIHAGHAAHADDGQAREITPQSD